MVYSPRPHQRKVLAYTHGKMGISAVPGSGKTWTLSRLAADIISRGQLAEDQEILVVTLVNSAVDNFNQRVRQFLQEKELLPVLGYRVRTLHGLANDIVRERPGLVNLSDNFQIIDEREADGLRSDATQTWLQSHPYDLDGWLKEDLDDNRLDWLRQERIPDLVEEIALGFIRSAKDRRLTPEQLRNELDRLPVPLPLAEMGTAIYTEYQRALAYRGAVDFDDLIRLAVEALHRDSDLLARLQRRWPYILEDEAQDSSRLQEEILWLLAGETGNWVRVGDPNQAIYETFTTANPQYLIDFLARSDVQAEELPESGRSSASIIQLANHLIEWTTTNHPVLEVRSALSPPYIQPVPPGSAGENPPDDPSQIYLSMRKFSAQAEIKAVADSLARWLPENPQATVAVLAPRNQRAFELTDELSRRSLPFVDTLLRSTSATRSSAGALGNLLRYLAKPDSASRLATVYRVWRRAEREDAERVAEIERHTELIRKSGQVEDYLWPQPGADWLEALGLESRDPETYTTLLTFRDLVRRWQGSTLLPIDQLVLTLAQDLFSESADLALAHNLAVLLRRANQAHSTWRLPELSDELGIIARNERRFLGFSDDDRGFDPDQYPGQVVVATIHKAKGLEWDRVYLMSANNYDFPGAIAGDTYIGEKWFARDSLNLTAEALAQFQALFKVEDYSWYQEGEATEQARLEYCRERLRLFYVGITRAKKSLVVTWNSGRRGEALPALPLAELASFWEQRQEDSGAGNLKGEV